MAGALCSIFAAKNKKATEFYEDMDTLNVYLREQGVHKKNKDLCITLRKYYSFFHFQRDDMNQILDRVCPSLQGRLAFQVQGLVS